MLPGWRYRSKVDSSKRGSVMLDFNWVIFRTSVHIIFQTDNFSTLCYVRADLSQLAGIATSKEGKGGKQYWTIIFSIEIHFGLTEFRARIKWNDKVSFGLHYLLLETSNDFRRTLSDSTFNSASIFEGLTLLQWSRVDRLQRKW